MTKTTRFRCAAPWPPRCCRWPRWARRWLRWPRRGGGAAQQQRSSPGYYWCAFGDFEVTALFDGVAGAGLPLAADEIQTPLARMFLETTPGVRPRSMPS